MFVLLEVLCSLALEPLLYGQSAGVSQVALLCSVAFWAWLWGPMGLLLATPLTVCLVVFAKHVPGMEFIGILVADAPPISPPIAFYQRLLAEDEDEAARIVADYAKDRPLEAVYDDLILPALARARRDRRQEQLRETEERYVWRAAREIVEDLHAKRHATTLAADAEGGTGPPSATPPSRTMLVLASPVRDEADELGLIMLGHIVDPACWTIELTSPLLLASEVISARGAHAAGGGLPGRASREQPRRPHALPEQAAPGALPRPADHRGALGATRGGRDGAAPSRGRGRELRGDDPGGDARAPADHLRAGARGAAGRDHDVAGPSTSSSIEASTGLVTCRSNPAASARRRSSACP